MEKQKIQDKVSAIVVPFMDSLARYQDGSQSMEEYGYNYWVKEDIQKVCQMVFDETYELISKSNEGIL